MSTPRCSCKELYRTPTTVAVVHDVTCASAKFRDVAHTATSVLVAAFNHVVKDEHLTYAYDLVDHLISVWNNVPRATRTYFLREVKKRLWADQWGTAYRDLFTSLIVRDKESPDPVDE